MKKYISELVITNLTEQELLEMTNITSKTTGIDLISTEDLLSKLKSI